MTVMPGQLVSAEHDKAILLTLEEFKRHDLTQSEVISDLRLLFDGHPDESLARALVKYLDGMLSRVACDEISNETAASDIHQMITAVMFNDPSAECLAQLNRD
jgi:hypothetical protein